MLIQRAFIQVAHMEQEKGNCAEVINDKGLVNEFVYGKLTEALDVVRYYAK